MPQDPTDERQPHAAAGAHACEGMPKVVDVDILNPRKLADAIPFLVEPVEMTIASRGGKNPYLAAIHPASLFFEKLGSNARKRDDLGSGRANSKSAREGRHYFHRRGRQVWPRRSNSLPAWRAGACSYPKPSPNPGSRATPSTSLPLKHSRVACHWTSVAKPSSTIRANLARRLTARAR